MKNAMIVIFILAAVALGVVIARNRPSPDQEAIVYRQALMTVIDGTMSPLLLMQRGRVPYDAVLVHQHAAELTMLSGMIPEAFERNTSSARNVETAAVPAIWSRHTDFLKSAQRLGVDASDVQSAVRAGDEAQVRSTVGALDAECAQCHRAFREN